jgi:hypothetical protein
MMAARAEPSREPGGCRIGLDLDNTIIDYRQLFADVAIGLGLVGMDFVGDKFLLRQTVRALPDGERRWTELQAEVYGACIAGARMMRGALDFVRRAVALGVPVFIVSHKTRRPAADPNGVDLRDAATAWLRQHGFLAADALVPAQVFYETTRSEKIARIRALGCTVFVDDLTEVFNDTNFPGDVDRFLLAEDGAEAGDYQVVASWQDVEDSVFSRWRHVG